MGDPTAPEPSRPSSGAGFTVLDVLKASEAWLQQRSIEAPRRSAELLLGRVLGMDRMQVYLAFERPMVEAERAAMRAMLKRRGGGEPVAYILGDWSFRNLELKVTPEVLIPRPETEELVDHVLRVLPAGGAVLDLGTGSGAIALAVAEERPDATVVATDASAAALAVARENAASLGLSDRVRFFEGDWWGALASADAGIPFDVAVSNPPYVDPDQPEHLESAVRDHEPALALFTPPGDPGAPYRAIAAGSLAAAPASHLKPGSWLLLESGRGAMAATEAAVTEAGGFQEIEVVKDLGGEPRFLRAQRAP